MYKNTTSLLLLITFLFSSLLYSQPYGWYTQTSGTTSNLNNVKFFNTDIGTVVGQAGKILRTTNSGVNWVSQTSGTTNHLFGVHFINTNTGWAVGDIGTILKTTNGGTNWITQTSNILYQLRSISFLNTATGYIVGWYGTIMRTTNGGTNWVTLNTGTSNNLHGISFANNNTGFVVGWYGTIIKTTNGGNNWSTLSSGTTSTLEDVTFFDTQNGLIIGENGRTQRTTNGGTSWTVLSSGTGNWISGITSPHANFATMVGELGVIRVTTNGGTNWYSQVSNTGNWLNKINYVDTLNGWAVGDYGTIIHTTTGGWLLPTAPSLSSPSNNSSCVSLTPALSWAVVFPPVCTYRVQVSTSSSFTSTIFDSSGILYLNCTVPTSRLSNSSTYYWRVVATNQVGVGPWSSVRNFRTTYITPAAPTLVAPSNNSYITTFTPLLNWDSVTSSSSFRVRVSDDSTFATTVIDESGLNISQYQVPAGILQNDIKYYWLVNASNPCNTSTWSQKRSFYIYQVPNAPTLVSPTNNSSIGDMFLLFDWDSVSYASTFRLEVSTNPSFTTMVIDTSGLTVSNFLSLTFGILQSNTSYYWRVNAANPYATSPWSQTWIFNTLTIITNTNGNEGKIPTVFKLYNNYPNPFNPVTKIKFDLPENSYVRLKVYDISGKEVARLINLKLSAGTYEYQWNAEKYSSGVYFYKIEAGSFTDVKRMVLIK